MTHHQETHGVHAQRARVFDVLSGHVGFGAVGGHAHGASAGVVSGLEVMNRSDTGQQQYGDLGIFNHIGGRFDPFQIGVCAKAVVEA
ncbi:hypothetical protein D3C86_1920150 [compost metagenome]